MHPYRNEVAFRGLQPNADRLIAACKESARSWNARIPRRNAALAAYWSVSFDMVFDSLAKEKAIDIGNSLRGLMAAVLATVLTPFINSKMKEDKEPSIARKVVAFALLLVRLLVSLVVLCPPAVMCLLGMYISTGISLWRLIQHDYGNTDGDTNLKPALNILYSLVVAQGVVCGYSVIYDLATRSARVENVAYAYSLEVDPVFEYLDETMAGCMKDPSFARGRNLVTYAVELLMKSESRYGYVSGVLILGRVVLETGRTHGQRGVMKELLTQSASFSHVVQRLVETFGPTSPYSTEIRVRAARIVATVAGNIRLDHFPAQGMLMIQCISSLLDTFEEYNWRPEGYKRQDTYYNVVKEYEREWLLDRQEPRYLDIYTIPSARATDSGNPLHVYRGLVVQGLRILQGLAVNEDNCRVISNTQGLLSKAIAPLVVLDQIHSGDQHDDEWCSMAEESLELMKRLMATPYPQEEETKTWLPSKISGCSQVIIRTIKGILECLMCQVLLKRQAVEVLLDLSDVDTHTAAPIMSGGSSSTMFVWMLLHISLVPDYHFDRMCGATHLAKKSSDIARLADKRLQAMLSSSSLTEPSATSMLRSVGDVICSLATAVADAENNAYIRVHAATILRHLVHCYTKNDENLKQLKKAMADVMPKVLIEIVYGRDTREAKIQAETEENNGGKVLPAAGMDLEQGGVSHDNGHESSSTHQQKGEQHQGIQLQEALINLCRDIYLEWIDEDQDLTRQFNEITAKICSGQGMPDKTFGTLVREARGKLRETANSSSET